MNPRKINPDRYPSTLNTAKIAALKVYSPPPSYRAGNTGMGCAGDAPGFPTYFVQPVFNRHGNPPRNAPNAVIMGPDGQLRVMPEDRETWGRFYLPLPFDHVRVQCWVASTMQHFRHCYRDEERPEYGRAGTLIYPVPYYKLRSFRDDPRWSEEYRAAAKAEVEAFNHQELERAARIATVDNHQGVRAIRKVYPDFAPSAEQIDSPAPFPQADWWTSDEERPTPDICPGDYWKAHPKSGRCIWCGHGA